MPPKAGWQALVWMRLGPRRTVFKSGLELAAEVLRYEAAMVCYRCSEGAPTPLLPHERR